MVLLLLLLLLLIMAYRRLQSVQLRNCLFLQKVTGRPKAISRKKEKNHGQFSLGIWYYRLCFVEFCFTRSLGNRSPASHLAALLSYMVWILFGCVQPNSILLIISNAACCLVVIYHLLLLTICSKSWIDARHKVVALVILEIIFVGVVATIVLTLAPDIKLRSHIIGMIAMICHFGTFAAPLSSMKLVITTRDTDHLNFSFATFSIVGCFFWMAYALDPVDLYLLVPNAVGWVLAGVELFLEVLYYKTASHKWSAANLGLSQSASSPNAGCDNEAPV